MEEPRGDISVSQFLRAVLIAGVLLGGAWVIYTIRGTLLPFGLAFVLSYILVPVVDYMESHRINRMASVAVVLISMLGLFILAVATFIPVLITGMGHEDPDTGRSPRVGLCHREPGLGRGDVQ